jgi:uncharacterized repeat protein (TIGR03803 family)
MRELQDKTMQFARVVRFTTIALAGVLALGGVGASQSAEAQTFSVLHSFTGGADGANPYAGLIQDSTGNFYGTTQLGGTSNLGAVFKLDPTGTEIVLHSFAGGADGANPYSGLVQDSTGNLYGTTYYGGAPNHGTVFKLDPTGTETVLYSFAGGADGANPYASLVQDPAGNLYGTTQRGGSSGQGTVFKIDTVGTETVLYGFTGGSDGGGPDGALVLDAAGNLYGTTFGGGDLCVHRRTYCGVVFKLDTTGTETVLHTFTGGTDGVLPVAGVVRDSAGNLYGTTSNAGTIFQLDATGTETVLYSFTGGAGGGTPYAGLVRDPAGNLYGTTNYGGDSTCGNGSGCGVVFQLDTTGTETVLYTFTGGADGANPELGSLIRDSAGNLYGTTQLGGASNNGVVFKITGTAATFNVSVVLAGSGSGTVTSNPAGINCSSTCSANFISGTTATLTPIADAGSSFSGWSGGCSGMGSCTLTTSISATATFNALLPDYSLAPASVSLTVQPGGQVTDAITIAPQNGAYESAIQLACTVAGPSPMPTCALSPTSVTPGANAVVSTLTVTAPVSARLALPVGWRIGPLYALCLPLTLVGMIPVVAAKHRRRRHWAMGGILLLSILQVACGGASQKPGPTNYTVTVTGTSGAIPHTTQVTVTVQ